MAREGIKTEKGKERPSSAESEGQVVYEIGGQAFTVTRYFADGEPIAKIVAAVAEARASRETAGE